jgi:hypothetical protein
VREAWIIIRVSAVQIRPPLPPPSHRLPDAVRDGLRAEQGIEPSSDWVRDLGCPIGGPRFQPVRATTRHTRSRCDRGPWLACSAARTADIMRQRAG